MEALQQEEIYTVDDIYALPDGTRAELIDGQIYDMATPSRIHQRICHTLAWKIETYIREKKGDCEVYPAPFAVFLNQDAYNYVEPDISVICDREKLDERGCNGAPDWIVEIASPSTQKRDYGIKLFKYRAAGVREYWIVNPATEAVNVYSFDDFDNEEGDDIAQYSFDAEIPVHIFEDFSIRISELL